MARETSGVGLPTKAPVEGIPAVISSGSTPEFLDYPGVQGRERYSSLRRGALNTLCLPCPANKFKPPVKSISLRRPGCKKGKRLIVAEGHFGEQMGLLTYLRTLVAQQNFDTAFAAAGGK